MKRADLGLNLSTRRTRKRNFLGEVNRVVPLHALVATITPHSPEGRRDRAPFPIETVFRNHILQRWARLNESAMEEALHKLLAYREFADLNPLGTRLDLHVGGDQADRASGWYQFDKSDTRQVIFSPINIFDHKI